MIDNKQEPNRTNKNQDRNIYLKEYNKEEIRYRDVNINYFSRKKNS